jgi:hypothetical protein
MTHTTDILTLARWMAADFSNQEQAFENPPLYAHIRVCMRPLPLAVTGNVSFLLEQAYDFMLNDPYRIRVLNLCERQGRIEIENYQIQDEQNFYGASRNPKRLQQLRSEQLEKMPGCTFIVEWLDDRFKARVEPGKGCLVFRKEQSTYLESEFEVDEHQLISLDRGRDPDTDELVWGSIAGAFHFAKWQSFADEVQV